MTNKKSTKKALLVSGMSLLICFTMLIGTTFAWFTDSVTSANNIIQSGNLDVELYYQVEGQSDWTKVDANTNVFMKDALWEPGHTEVVKLKVVNEGSLALKYNLGVNVASEKGSVNVNGADFKLSDYIKFGIVDGAQTYTREQAVAAVDATAKTLKTAYNSGSTKLLAGDENVVTMVVYMPTTVGNEANYAKGATVPTINLGINLFATQVEAEADSFDENYDKDAMTFVTTATEAQAALDNATAGTIIKLAPGVDYGTLYLRPVAGSAATKNVDWIGNNYVWETYTLFEDITILGDDGAIIDTIEIEGGTYYNAAHSQKDAYPVMLSLVELKNVVIDGVTFTGNGNKYGADANGNAISFAGNNIKVDGLTIKNCVLEDPTNKNRLLYKSESTTHVHAYEYDGETYTFTPSLKDIVVTDCTFNGGYMGLELRETENLTITNNIFNVADRNILLPTNTGYTYSGTITITGNVSNNAKERFVRADGTGDAVVIIKNNTLNNYMGSDEDYIKVTNGNNITIENNTLASIGVKDTAAAQKALDKATTGTTIQLQPGVNYGELCIRPTAANVTNMSCNWDGHSCVTTDVDEWVAHMASGNHVTYYTAEINNVTIAGAEGATVAGFVIASSNNKEYEDAVAGLPANSYTHYDSMNINGLTFKDVAFVGKVNIHSSLDDVVYDGVTFDGCSFNTNDIVTTNGQAIRYYSETNNGNVKNIVVKNCTFTNCYQGVYAQNVYGVTVTDCTFDTTGHNAIANHLSGKIKVVITNNTFKNIGDRVIRFGEVGADSDITIQNNVATNSGDDDGQVMKATSIASGIVTSISNNNWGAGKIVANTELQDE